MPGKHWLLGAVCLVGWVTLSDAFALAAGGPAAEHLIGSAGVGPVRLGMTVAQARRALPGKSLRRSNLGDGLALVQVSRGDRQLFDLYAGEDDYEKPIDERARIQMILAADRAYATAAGVRPEMPVREVEKRYGKLKQIRLQEVESREFATFTHGPSAFLFEVYAPDGGYAGKYSSARPDFGATTRQAAPNARIYRIWVQGRQR